MSERGYVALMAGPTSERRSTAAEDVEGFMAGDTLFEW